MLGGVPAALAGPLPTQNDVVCQPSQATGLPGPRGLCWEDSQSSLDPATSQEGTRLGRRPQSLTQAAGSRGQRSRQPHAACGRLEAG